MLSTQIPPVLVARLAALNSSAWFCDPAESCQGPEHPPYQEIGQLLAYAQAIGLFMRGPRRRGPRPRGAAARHAARRPYLRAVSLTFATKLRAS